MSVPQAARCEAADPSQVASAPAKAVATEPSEGAGKLDQPGPTMARAEVCVCVDDTGKIVGAPVLTNSSGIAGFDKAALELSAAARYRPPSSTGGGQTAAGCFRFKVGVDVR